MWEGLDMRISHTCMLLGCDIFLTISHVKLSKFEVLPYYYYYLR